MLGPKEEYEQLPQILAGCHSTLLCMDARCCVMTRLFVLYEIWATLEAAKESGGDHPKLEVRSLQMCKVNGLRVPVKMGPVDL